MVNRLLFGLYVDYLICSTSYTTATGLSKLTNNTISHDKITKLLSSNCFTSADLWQEAKPTYKKIEESDGMLVLDDSIEEKPYTNENEIVAWHWDHKENRSVKGINFISLLYVSSKGSVPLGFDVVKKDVHTFNKKTGKATRKASVSKQEYFRALIEKAIINGINFKYVLADSWFASAENMRFIKNYGKNFVFSLKCNRNVALSDADLTAGKFVRIDSLGLEDGKTVRLEGVDFPLRLTLQVFKNEDASTGALYLASSDLELTDTQISIIYQKRWKIETYHKSLKCNVSLAKSPTKTSVTQVNHLFASLCAYIKLEQIMLYTKNNHFALKEKIYIEALKAGMLQLQKMTTQTILPTVTNCTCPA